MEGAEMKGDNLTLEGVYDTYIAVLVRLSAYYNDDSSPNSLVILMIDITRETCPCTPGSYIRC
jgi:hypothetical protein